MTHWVMDIETLSNCFTAVFEAHNSDERKIFIIHELKNDIHELMAFLNSNIEKDEYHIGFNNLEFDAQVIEYIIQGYEKAKSFTGDELAKSIYNYAQGVITKPKDQFSDYPEWVLSIKQIDLYKLNHWDNPAKRSSLKWIQFSMDWHNLQDMPIHHTTKITTKKQIKEIISYNINDVSSTKKIFELSKKAIELRSHLSKKFKMNLMSASEPRMGKEVFAMFMANKMKISKKEVKKKRTYRTKIEVKNIILPYIKFRTKTFNDLLDWFNNLEINANNIKGSVKRHVNYKGVETHFGSGGVHGACASGVYKSNEDTIIMSSDVVSFYPNLVIRNRWSPQHFPAIDFCHVYELMFNKRRQIPKSNPMNYFYKIILNSVFGLSNDENSFFYDPELTLRITINGQLSLMMLYENIMETIPGSKSIMQNTDGFEIAIPRKYKEQYLELCKEWEERTLLQLEHDEYEKIILGDVNNYIGMFSAKEVAEEKYRELQAESPYYKFFEKDGSYFYNPIKMKGRFDFHNLALHKNKSKLVVKKAIHAFFVNNILPKDYIKTNKNIFDYCVGVRAKGDWKMIAYSSHKGKIKKEEVQKVNRYYISNKGCKLIKVKGDSEIKTESNRYMQSVLNKYKDVPFENYDVNLNYYIAAAEKEINSILQVASNQTQLF